MGKMNRKEAREQAFILVFEKSFRDEPVPEIIEAAKEELNDRLDGGKYVCPIPKGVKPAAINPGK